MSTPIEPLSRDPYASFAARPAVLPAVDPNNPSWGVPTAIMVWASSVAALLLTQFAAIISYAIYYRMSTGQEALIVLHGLENNAFTILLSVVAIIPAHLLTLGVVWAVVTGFGKRPFWRALGWGWGDNLGFWGSAGLALLLLLLGAVLTYFLKGDKTTLDQIIASSSAARFTTAFLAVATAPLVEELIYRGVLYPAFQRAVGVIGAIICVSVLFTMVHVPQYLENPGVIAAITLLSFSLTVVRAWTGRLLPCFIIHLIFNALQAAVIVLEPFIKQAGGDLPNAPTAALLLGALQFFT